MVTHSTKAAKAKSRLLQNSIVDLVLENFRPLDDTDVRPAIMGESGIDIKLSKKARALFPFGGECKAREKLDIWQSLEQTEINAKKEHLIPLLIFKRARSKTYAVLEIGDFMKLARNQKKED